MKNHALETELPGLRNRAKSPQRLTKSYVSAASSIFIFTVCLKLMTWSGFVTMETGVIYLPRRGLALTESEQASSCKQCLPILYEEDMQKKDGFMELRNLGKYFKWRHLRAKGRKGLKKYGDWCSFSPPYLCLFIFLFFGMPFAIQNGDLSLVS